MSADSTILGTELPTYLCHKTVHAAKILDIRLPKEPEAVLRLDLQQLGQASVVVSSAYMQKHQPKVGGYYVVYADGYTSFSPADAFEDGYTRI